MVCYYGVQESDKVLTFQKKAIRLISNSSYISHTIPSPIKNRGFIQAKIIEIILQTVIQSFTILF